MTTTTSRCCGADLQRVWEPLPLLPQVVRLTERCVVCDRPHREQLATVYPEPGATALRKRIERSPYDE